MRSEATKNEIPLRLSRCRIYDFVFFIRRSFRVRASNKLPSRVMKVHHAEAFVSSAGHYGSIATETAAAIQVSMTTSCRRHENGSCGGDRSPTSVAAAASAAAVARRCRDVDDNDVDDNDVDGCSNCTAEQHRVHKPRHRSGSWP